MIEERVAPVADASHEHIAFGVVNRDVAGTRSLAIGRVPLVRFAWLVGGYDAAVIVWGAHVRASGFGAGCGSHGLWLGDTIFPADSLRPAVVQDLLSNSPILLRLRVLRALAFVIGPLYCFWLYQVFWRKQKRSAWMPFLPITLTGQIGLGAMSVMPLAPLWLRLTHLLVAELFWILLVLASADQLLASHHSGVRLSRKKSAAAHWSLAFKTTDRISRRGGLSS